MCPVWKEITIGYAPLSTSTKGRIQPEESRGFSLKDYREKVKVLNMIGYFLLLQLTQQHSSIYQHENQSKRA